MNDKLLVNVNGIIDVAKSIDNKRNDIMSLYNNDILSVLNQSSECFKVAGMDYDGVKKSFASVFNTLDERIKTLTSLLTDTIIPKYQNTSNVISSMFNEQFAVEMNEIIKKMNN